MPDFLLSPLTYALLLVATLAPMWRHLPRWVRVVGLLAGFLLLATMAPVGANVLVGWVESQVPGAQACTRPYPSGIVVLSGGTERPPRSREDFAALDDSSLHRLLAGISLWSRQPNAQLIFAGGGRPIPESILMGAMAERMGVPAGAVETEQRSRTTWENAEYVAQLSPTVPKRIWLVSSALHLPRAVAAFRHFGFEPCAWPSGSLHVPFEFHIGYFMPQTSSLGKTDQAIHEIVGGWVYAWRARRESGEAKRSAGQ